MRPVVSASRRPTGYSRVLTPGRRSTTVTRPAAMISSAARREATPACARCLARRIVGRSTPAKLPCSAMDLALLDDRLAALGEPRFRAGQVWEWTARGAAGYDEMTNLPAGLRERLAAEVPF